MKDEELASVNIWYIRRNDASIYFLNQIFQLLKVTQSKVGPV